MPDQPVTLKDLANEMPVSPTTTSRIESVGLVGGGVMGRGLAQTLSSNGLNVIIVEKDDHRAQLSIDGIAENLDREIERWAMTSGDVDGLTGDYKFSIAANFSNIVEAVSSILNLDEAETKHLMPDGLNNVTIKNETDPERLEVSTQSKIEVDSKKDSIKFRVRVDIEFVWELVSILDMLNMLRIDDDIIRSSVDQSEHGEPAYAGMAELGSGSQTGERMVLADVETPAGINVETKVATV